MTWWGWSVQVRVAAGLGCHSELGSEDMGLISVLLPPVPCPSVSGSRLVLCPGITQVVKIESGTRAPVRRCEESWGCHHLSGHLTWESLMQGFCRARGMRF